MKQYEASRFEFGFLASRSPPFACKTCTVCFSDSQPSCQLGQVSVSEVLHRALIAGIGERREGNDTNPVVPCTEIPSLSAMFSLVQKVRPTNVILWLAHEQMCLTIKVSAEVYSIDANSQIQQLCERF